MKKNVGMLLLGVWLDLHGRVASDHLGAPQ